MRSVAEISAARSVSEWLCNSSLQTAVYTTRNTTSPRSDLFRVLFAFVCTQPHKSAPTELSFFYKSKATPLQFFPHRFVFGLVGGRDNSIKLRTVSKEV